MFPCVMQVWQYNRNSLIILHNYLEAPWPIFLSLWWIKHASSPVFFTRITHTTICFFMMYKRKLESVGFFPLVFILEALGLLKSDLSLFCWKTSWRYTIWRWAFYPLLEGARCWTVTRNVLPSKGFISLLN